MFFCDKCEKTCGRLLSIRKAHAGKKVAEGSSVQLLLGIDDVAHEEDEAGLVVYDRAEERAVDIDVLACDGSTSLFPAVA